MKRKKWLFLISTSHNCFFIFDCPVTDTVFLSIFAQDLQFVITLSFHTLWFLRSRKVASQKMSIMEVIEYYHPECKGMTYLEEEDCKFLIIMDSFDCYQAPLDWEVSHPHTTITI